MTKDEIVVVFPEDIWYCISEFYMSKATLRALCLACKYLRGIFNPVLYRNIFIVDTNNHWTSKLYRLNGGNFLRHVKHFDTGDWRGKVALPQSILQQLLHKMTQLRFCRVILRPSDEDIFCHSKVTHVVFLPASAGNPRSIPMFKNLLSLQIEVDPTKFDNIKALALVLVNSPALQDLSLQLSHVDGENLTLTDPLQYLMAEFKRVQLERRGPTIRLRLRCLVIHAGFVLRRSGVQNNDALWTLTDPAHLETLKLIYGPEEEFVGHRDHLWLNAEIFAQAKALLYISITRLCPFIEPLLILLTDTPIKTLRGLEVLIQPGLSFMTLEMRQEWLALKWQVLHIDTGAYLSFLCSIKPMIANAEEITVRHLTQILCADPTQIPFFPKLRYLSIDAPRAKDWNNEVFMAEIARFLFSYHVAASRKEGLVSRLQYIRIDNRIYAPCWSNHQRSCNWSLLTILELGLGSSDELATEPHEDWADVPMEHDLQAVKLEPEEALLFQKETRQLSKAWGQYVSDLPWH